jgi:hypothetical protein
MGEILVLPASEFPLILVLAIVSLAALGIVFLLQPGEGGDDDDNSSNGGGGGGLMQPVFMGAS